jgi:hypothetical protein
VIRLAQYERDGSLAVPHQFASPGAHTPDAKTKPDEKSKNKQSKPITRMK